MERIAIAMQDGGTGAGAIHHIKSRLMTTKIALFNDLVGTGEQGRWHIEAEHPRGPEIDHKLEFHCLLDWQGSRLFAFENPRCVATGETIGVRLAGAVTH